MITATPESDERWELAALPLGERADAFSAIVADTHLPWNLTLSLPREEQHRYRADIRRKRLGRLVLVEAEADPCAGTRGDRELDATPGEWVVVLMNLGGREIIEQNGRRVDMRPGSVLMWDGSRPARFEVVQSLRKRTLFVPRQLVTELCGNLDEVCAVALEPLPITNLLVSFVNELRRQWDTLDQVGKSAGERAALELLAASLKSEFRAGPQTLHAALFTRICATVEERLTDPELRPPMIAAAHGISLRTLHTIFAENGETVGGWIRRRRLERSRDELLRPNCVSITAMAFRWGFTDSAHFSRAFKAEYGLSPRDLRVAATGRTGEHRD